MTNWVDGAIAAGGAVAGAAVTGFWSWMRHQPRGLAHKTSAQAVYQQALNDQAQTFITAMRELVDQQRGEILRLEGRIADLEEDNTRCHGENRQQRAIIDAMRRELIAAGIPIPPDPPAAFLLAVERDGVTTLGAVREHRGPRGKGVPS